MKWLNRIWNTWVDWVDKLPKPAHPTITLENLRWNLEVRVIKNDDMRFGAGLKLSNSQCADVLAILNTNAFTKAVAAVRREQRLMQRLQSHNIALPPFGCTWDRCVTPCESQAEHDGKGAP